MLNSILTILLLQTAINEDQAVVELPTVEVHSTRIELERATDSARTTLHRDSIDLEAPTHPTEI